MEELQNKTALITGGSKGIGFGIAKELISHGVNVAITGRGEQTIQAGADELNSLGESGRVLPIQADVTDYDSQANATAKTVEEFGSLDILIANAGVGHFASIEDMTSGQWHQTMDINLTGVFNTIKPAINYLKSSKGYFITIASLAGTNFFAGGAAYNASKFGLVGMSQAIMLDLRDHGIKVTTIMPGSVSSYFGGREPTDDWRIQPEDLGQMVVDLLKMHPRTLPSKVEVRPSIAGK